MFRPRVVALATVVLSSVLVLSCLAPLAFADAAGAKKYLEEAKKEFADGKADKAEVNLKLADAELDGVPATDPVAKEVAALRTQMSSAATAEAKVEFDKNLTYILRMAKESLGSKSDNKTYTSQLEELVNSPEGKKFLTDAQRADYVKQVATMRKTSAVMTLDSDAVRLDQALKRAEDRLPEVLDAVKKNGTDITDAANLSSTIEGLRKELADLPADHAKVKPLLARLAKLSDTFNAEVGKGMNAEAVAQLKRMWDLYETEWGGWEQETAATWAEYTKVSGQNMSYLNQPKTAALVTRADSFKKNVEENEKLKASLAAPDVKAVTEDVARKREAAMAKLTASIAKLLDDAAKDKLDKDKADKLGYFVDNIRLMLNSDPRMEPLQARAKSMVEKFEGAMVGASKAADELLQKLTADAASQWPVISAKFPGNDSSFNAPDAIKNIDKYKGKTVRFENARNRLGWDYSPGDYDFALDRDGVPIAARFDPALKAAVAQIKAKTGKELPDEGWDVVAVVDGLAKMKARRSADVTDNGTRIATVEGHETVDAPLLRIIAVHAGPVAAAAGVGAVTASGDVTPIAAGGGTMAAASAGAGGGWLWRVLTLIIGLAAAACALMKANFAPLANVPQAGAVRTKLGDDNLGYIGIALALLGVIWLIRGSVIHGLLTSLAIIAAGLYVALDMLVAKGVIKPDLAAKVKPLGVVIGLACAALVGLSFITGGSLVVI